MYTTFRGVPIAVCGDQWVSTPHTLTMNSPISKDVLQTECSINRSQAVDAGQLQPSVLQKTNDVYAEMMRQDNPAFASLPAKEVGKPLKFNDTHTASSIQYDCVTQKDRLGFIVLGTLKNDVTLWANGCTIKWVARADGYPSRDNATYAAQGVASAADAWTTIMQGRVKFEYTEVFNDACFQVAYGGDQNNVLASAFFPDDYNNPLNTLYVYKRQFDDDQKTYVTNTMAHELGHVLGLRHEFAQEGIPGWLQPEDSLRGPESVIYGTRNEKSVMAYYVGQQIQQSDVDDIRSAYDKLLPGIEYVGSNAILGKVRKTARRVLPDN